MKNTKKMYNFCIRVNEETAQQVASLADYYQRTASDLLRLLLVPALCELWAKMETEKHEENKQAPTLARFKQ